MGLLVAACSSAEAIVLKGGQLMLTQPLIQQLHELRLRGMAAALEQQHANTDRSALSFEERLGLMIQHNDCVGRDSRRAR